MKKILILFISLLMMSGCQSEKKEDTSTDTLYQQYVQYYDKIKACQEFDKELDDFQVKLILNSTNNNNIRYDIIIDHPNIEMCDIKAIAYVEDEQKYNPVSIGLLEDNTYSLIPDTIDKENGVYKGINLSGMTSLRSFRLKLYITYHTNGKYTERYILFNGNAS